MYLPARPLHYLSSQSGLDRRARLYLKQRGKCYWCERFLRLGTPWNKPDSVTEDHLIPRAYGGKSTMENLAGACMRCNCLRFELSEPFFRHLIKLYGQHLPEHGTPRYARLQNSIRRYLDGRPVRIRIPIQSQRFVCEETSGSELPRGFISGRVRVVSFAPAMEEKH